MKGFYFLVFTCDTNLCKAKYFENYFKDYEPKYSKLPNKAAPPVKAHITYRRYRLLKASLAREITVHVIVFKFVQYHVLCTFSFP